MGLSPWAAMGLALLDMEVRWVCGLDKRGQACGLAVWACVRSAQGKKGQLPGGLCKRVGRTGCTCSARRWHLFAQAVGQPLPL